MNYNTAYNKWLESDKLTVSEKNYLKELSREETEDSFYRDLEFGTGGLCGVMGLGTNRMNIYTVRRATQGLASEILDCGADFAEKGVVIAHDSRNNSRAFALEAANVLCANGIKTYLFDSLRPTPEFSFAVRYLGCARGIVITASHNPKEYNGYKVYGEDGGQIPPSVADKIIKYIDNTDIFDGVKLCENPKINIIGEKVDSAYIKAVKEQSLGTKSLTISRWYTHRSTVRAIFPSAGLWRKRALKTCSPCRSRKSPTAISRPSNRPIPKTARLLILP